MSYLYEGTNTLAVSSIELGSVSGGGDILNFDGSLKFDSLGVVIIKSNNSIFRNSLCWYKLSSFLMPNELKHDGNTLQIQAYPNNQT
nr:hypothetical protein BCU48_01170 [Vibrio splendidus]